MIITTARKIALASLAFRLLTGVRALFGLPPEIKAARGGVHWALDLREGIDFSIYLLGGFEPATLALYRRLVSPGDYVLDVGANIGSHTLPLALLVGSTGKVLAFEPTRFAVEKLRANAALNPELQTRIEAHQLLLVGASTDEVPPAIYSSWPLIEAENVHAQHRGRLMGTEGARAVTLDGFLAERQLAHVDFIKIDVDGNEPAVLRGALETIQRHRPKILMEIAPYLFDDAPEQFHWMLSIFGDLGYSFFDADTGRELPSQPDALVRFIPAGASRNVLLTAR